MKKIYIKNDGDSDYLDTLIKTLKDLESKYPKSIKNNIVNHLLYQLDYDLHLIEECETPIEVLLGLEIRREIDSLNGTEGLYYYLHPQYEIEVSDSLYRVDFLLAPVMAEKITTYPNIVIECDGHDYHERTKEQAKRDRARERELLKAGYRVVRFTGSEIVANPKKCAWEVISITKQVQKELGFGD